ncbi:MAG: FAD-dependent oxidoreductase [Lentisphaeria bacterium]|nr:FAD-dependent oxidoreductase [Lentisphaeria bacterium]
MKYDYNLVAIGAGAAGLVTTYIGAAVKAKVALIEKHKMGGDCLNTGCVPSKALIRTAHFLHDVQNSEKLGIKNASVEYDFADIMERVQRVIEKIEPHDSVERYTSLGVDCIQGEAKIKSPHEIEINGKTITTKSIVIATGARPFIPEISGIQQVNMRHTDNIWEIREQPKKMLVLGGGPIGSELAQAFNRIGISVTLVQRGAQLLVKEDTDIAKIVQEQMIAEGVDLRLNTSCKAFKNVDGRDVAILEESGKEEEFPFDLVLLALGRQPNVTGFGLEELGVELEKSGRIKINDYAQTSISNIFACGDVASKYQFTHMASHGAYYCAVNALFGKIPFAKQKVNLSNIPWCTYTSPEVARVGLSEKEAKEQKIPYEVTTYNLDDLDRAITDEADQGIMKVLTPPDGKDEILGITICGYHAGDIIPEYVLARNYKMGLGKIMGTIHIYPTIGEANKYLAGQWKQKNKPEIILNWLKKFHNWQRK